MDVKRGQVRMILRAGDAHRPLAGPALADVGTPSTPYQALLRVMVLKICLVDAFGGDLDESEHEQASPPCIVPERNGEFTAFHGRLELI